MQRLFQRSLLKDRRVVLQLEVTDPDTIPNAKKEGFKAGLLGREGVTPPG